MSLRVWLKRKFCHCKHSVVIERRFNNVGFGFCENCDKHYFINFEEDTMIEVSPAWYAITLAHFDRVYLELEN